MRPLLLYIDQPRRLHLLAGRHLRTGARWRTRARVCVQGRAATRRSHARAVAVRPTDPNPNWPHRTAYPRASVARLPLRCTHDWATALVALCVDRWAFTGRAFDALLTRHLAGGKSRRPTMPICFLTCPTAQSRRCNVRKQTRRSRACLPIADYSRLVAVNGRRCCRSGSLRRSGTAAGTLNELGRYVRVVMRPVSAQGVVGEYSKSDVGPVELDPGELTALPWLLRPVVTPRAPRRP